MDGKKVAFTTEESDLGQVVQNLPADDVRANQLIRAVRIVTTEL